MPRKPRRSKPQFRSAIEREGNVVRIDPNLPLFIDRDGKRVSLEEAKKKAKEARL